MNTYEGSLVSTVSLCRLFSHVEQEVLVKFLHVIKSLLNLNDDLTTQQLQIFRTPRFGCGMVTNLAAIVFVLLVWPLTFCKDIVGTTRTFGRSVKSCGETPPPERLDKDANTKAFYFHLQPAAFLI